MSDPIVEKIVRKIYRESDDVDDNDNTISVNVVRIALIAASGRHPDGVAALTDVAYQLGLDPLDIIPR